MRQILRRYATTGIAIVGAGLIVATPGALPAPGLPNVQSPAVRLTDAWTDMFNTASQNATTLLNNFFLAPGVGQQQFLANQSDYANQLLNDPAGSSNDVMQQIQGHLAAVLTGWGLQDADSDTQYTVQAHTLDGDGNPAPSQIGEEYGHALIFNEASGYLPAGTDPATVMPIIDFLGSPASGIIMGSIGPVIAPWVALMNSITDGDGFSDTLANMVGAFFNGATLNLDALLPTINGLGLFPAETGMALTNLDVAFGGLLSTGSVGIGPYQELGEGGTVAASVPAVGGSIFNSIGLSFTGIPLLTGTTLDLPGQAIGPIGAWEAWGQIVGALLGSGWVGTGYHATGPVDVTAPLAGADLPTLPDDDGGTAGNAAADVASWFQDLLNSLSS